MAFVVMSPSELVELRVCDEGKRFFHFYFPFSFSFSVWKLAGNYGKKVRIFRSDTIREDRTVQEDTLVQYGLMPSKNGSCRNFFVLGLFLSKVSAG